MSTALAQPAREPEPSEAPAVREPPEVAGLAVALARSQAPLRRALCAIAGRVVATRAWEALGFARSDDYARERAGLSRRQLYELAHADAAFARVPRLGEAFVAREIDWSRACLLTRVVTPANVEGWLARAASLGVRALSREVREVDRRAAEAAGAALGGAGPGLFDATAEGPRENVVLALARPARARWSRARLLASRVGGHRARPAQVLEAVVAEALSALHLDPALPDAPSPEPCAPTPAPEVDLGDTGIEPWQLSRQELEAIPCSRPDAAGLPVRPADEALPPVLPPAVAPFLAGLTEGLEAADAFELDARLRRALRLEQQRMAKLARRLCEVAEGRLYRGLGFVSVAAFAREWLGLDRRTAQSLLRLERAGGRCPALGKAWRAGRLSWVQAHTLLPLLLREELAHHAAAWVAHAQRVTVLRLEDDVEQALATGEIDPARLVPGFPEHEAQMSAHTTGSEEALPSAGRAGWQRAERPRRFAIYGVPSEVARLLRAALATVQKRLERQLGRTSSESGAFEAMLEHALASWSALQPRVPREHRVFDRDGWHCRVPGCTSYANLHAHHIRFRSHGGSDALSNRVTLCAWHHLRGVHAGVVRITGQAPDALRFELGVRAGREALLTYGPEAQASGR